MRHLFNVKENQFATEATDKQVLIDDLHVAKITEDKEPRYQIRLNGTKKEVWVLGKQGDTYIIGVDGKEVEVSVADPFADLRDKMGFHKIEETHENEVKAPMPGKVIDFMVREGDEVEEGTPLFILEAMKMENIVKSPSNGTISTIVSKAGETVHKGDVIIKF